MSMPTVLWDCASMGSRLSNKTASARTRICSPFVSRCMCGLIGDFPGDRGECFNVWGQGAR
eukprot:7169274-Pyramimonas_sp.AAC.1